MTLGFQCAVPVLAIKGVLESPGKKLLPSSSANTQLCFQCRWVLHLAKAFQEFHFLAGIRITCHIQILFKCLTLLRTEKSSHVCHGRDY